MPSNDSVTSQQGVDNDARMTRRVLWKLDCHILPPLALLWLTNFIDRSNIGNAGIAGLESDLQLHGNQFNTALAVFYATYYIMELPSNIALKKLKANRWIPLLVGLWGIVTTFTSLIHNYKGLLAIRLFLGLCEGGLLPSMILYLSTMYKRHELQLRVGIFYASASLSGAFGGLLATAILNMNGIAGLAGWRWIYILEGISTVIIGFLTACVLPESLENASFFTEEERVFAVKRFRLDDSRIHNASPETGTKDVNDVNVEHADFSKYPEEEKFEWKEITRGLFDIQAWLTGLAFFGLLVSLYSYSLFLPTIVAGLGYTGSEAQLHTVPPYVPATVLTVVVAFLSDRFKWRGPFILICLPVAAIGYVLAITADNNRTRYIAVFLMAAGVYPTAPCILSILPNNSSGHYKKASTTALQIVIANSGLDLCAVLVRVIFILNAGHDGIDQQPKYIRGHTISLCFVVLAWILIACNVSYCLWENKARRDGKREDNLIKYKTMVDEGKTQSPIGDRHPDFRFTL